MKHISTLEKFTELTNNIDDLKFYVNIVSVAQSCKSRKMRFYIALSNELINITNFLSEYLGYTFHKESYSIVIKGGGMDMVQKVLNDLRLALQNQSANMADLKALQNIKIHTNNYSVI